MQNEALRACLTQAGTARGFPAMIDYFYIVPLDPALKAGVAGQAPVKN